MFCVCYHSTSNSAGCYWWCTACLKPSTNGHVARLVSCPSRISHHALCCDCPCWFCSLQEISFLRTMLANVSDRLNMLEKNYEFRMGKCPGDTGAAALVCGVTLFYCPLCSMFDTALTTSCWCTTYRLNRSVQWARTMISTTQRGIGSALCISASLLIHAQYIPPGGGGGFPGLPKLPLTRAHCRGYCRTVLYTRGLLSETLFHKGTCTVHVHVQLIWRGTIRMSRWRMAVGFCIHCSPSLGTW